MRLIILLAVFLFCSTSSAQEPAGIKFEKGLSWAQLREKAKKENKYIFLDCFTTWCGPCKLMDQEVFTRKNVGDFFNASFINVKAQFDSTKNDNEEVRRWYADVKDLTARFAIDSYPTYLFFNPDGKLVHKIKGRLDGDVFLTQSKAALNPDGQYYRLKAMFDNGQRGAPFLRNLLNVAFAVRESADYTPIANAYLSQRTDPLTTDEVNLLSAASFKMSDVGFNVLLKRSREAASLSERAKAARMVRDIIMEEIAVPFLRNGGKMTRHGFMKEFVIYTGEISEHVNWDTLRNQVSNRFPDLAEEVVMASQIMYFEWQKDWSRFCAHTNAFINKYGDKVDADQIYMYIHSVVNAPVDTQCAENALGWVKKAMVIAEGNNISRYLFQEAALLYKAQRREEAIDKMKKLIASDGDPSDQLAPILEKMKKYEKVF
ncbi:thioredoxin-like protein [Arcticibacter pallidicorallinus]|uniref:Thioredoxin-like protein n=1 Tax=Arcticibacter pallidicorallinus TaxID=1259464 RepID=A0A2T0TTY4_9SPHI|nr:thioredoxin fold domain-containing protein [Arcticibacter pallidicorallinus]PRY49117.1 thioredoxin-like protein [Arcticibacter pallidicorallinus]